MSTPAAQPLSHEAALKAIAHARSRRGLLEDIYNKVQPAALASENVSSEVWKFQHDPLHTRIIVVGKSGFTSGPSVAQECLSQLGYDVTRFDAIEEALDLLKNKTVKDYQLVLISGQPGANHSGMKSLHDIRALNTGIPVIILGVRTTKEAGDLWLKALQGGAYDAISPPFLEEGLVARVTGAIEVITFQQRMADLEQQLGRSTETFANLQHENAQLRSQVDSLQRFKTSLHSQMSNVAKQEQKKFNDLLEELNAANARNSELQVELSKSYEDNVRLQVQGEENANLREQMRVKHETLLQVQADLMKAKAEAKRKLEVYESAETLARTLESEKNELAQERNALLQTVATCEETIDTLRRRIRTLEHSNSDPGANALAGSNNGTTTQLSIPIGSAGGQARRQSVTFGMLPVVLTNVRQSLEGDDCPPSAPRAFDAIDTVVEILPKSSGELPRATQRSMPVRHEKVPARKEVAHPVEEDDPHSLPRRLEPLAVGSTVQTVTLSLPGAVGVPVSEARSKSPAGRGRRRSLVS